MARAIGSPLSDYHGLVSRRDAGLDAAEVLRAADLTAYRYTGLIDPFGVFGQNETKTAHVIDLGEPTPRPIWRPSARPVPRRSRTGAGWTASSSARWGPSNWSPPTARARPSTS
jgi:hypothetical protein